MRALPVALLLSVLAAAGALAVVFARMHALPTRRLAGFVLVTAPAWLLSDNPTGAIVAAALGAAVIIAALADLLVTPRPGDMIVEREMALALGVGDRTSGAYRITTRSPGALRFSLHDALPRGVERVGVTGAKGAVVPWTSGELRLEPEAPLLIPLDVEGRERGRWMLGPIVLRVLGPLALVRRTLRHEPSDTITVTPSLAGVRGYRLLSLQHRLRDAGVRSIRRRGEGTSFASLREYVVGDDPRHVDWKATARRQKLIAREYSVEQGQTVIIAIDAGRMMTQIAGSLPRFEYALSSALVLADVALHSDDRVGLVLFDDEVRTFVPPMRGAPALHAIRQALIPARASMIEPDYAAAFRMLAARHRKRSLIVLFTDVIDPRASQALVAYSARSAARHLPLIVALRNEQLMEAALPAATSSAARLFESAAAEELVQARHEAVAQMRRAGVAVLDIAPQAMTAAVINRYLEIKARASL
ncbi:MAG TPA: DUF58 domain-containing protein [Gemmatimonadaceae bacterium]|nr:DUF58 domain-containing protein [Gemmatimonadaceae bacterium]